MLIGATNFRDFAGHRLPDGRTIQPGRLFRSDHLADLHDEDLVRLRELGIRAIYDLRGAEEARAYPHRLPDPGPEVRPVRVEPRMARHMAEAAASGVPLAMAVRNAMIAGNRAYVTDHAPVFRALFDHLLADDGLPAVIHCTAGKDRTGFASAMVLCALGVDRETIVADYLETNRRWKPKDSLAPDFDPAMRRALFTADADYLAAAFETIAGVHGTVDAFLAGPIGLDDRRRARLVSLLVD